MRTFENWYADLISDIRWYELLRAYKPETIKKAAEKVYAQLVADKTEDVRPVGENRKHVYNIVCKNPGDKVLVPWHVQALQKKEDEKEEEWIPLTGSERQKKLAEFKAMVDAAPIISNVPRVSYKEIIEEGGVIPKKGDPYPVTTPEEAYVKDRHFEYIKYAYEPRTAQLKPGVMSEEQFNLEYDEKNLAKSGL